jgi:hypothetical protein
MTLIMPIRNPATIPSALEGQQNGNVDPRLLTWVEPNRTGLVWLMAELPARSMRAAHARARAAGIYLTSTGRGRTFQQQVDLFTSRYTMEKTPYAWVTDAQGNRFPVYVTKTWNGVIYYQLPGTAMAAVPGTSNHGWWCSDDLAEIVDGRVVPLRPSTIQWLFANLPDFGFYWETIKESWHVHWRNGDQLTQATIDYENGGAVPQPPTDPGYDGRYMNILYSVEGDIALFVATGVNMSWVPDETALNTLKFLGHIDADRPPVAINRGVLKVFNLAGPAPTYPANYTGQRTVASDFRTSF